MRLLLRSKVPGTKKRLTTNIHYTIIKKPSKRVAFIFTEN